MVLSGYLSCPSISVFPRSLSSFAGPLYAVLLLENQLWYWAVLQAFPGLTFEFQSFSLHPSALQLVASDFKAAKNLVFGPPIETKNNKKQPLQRPCPLSESNRGSSHNARLLRVLKWIRPCFFDWTHYNTHRRCTTKPLLFISLVWKIRTESSLTAGNFVGGEILFVLYIIILALASSHF